MTVDDVRKAIGEINDRSRDDEVAHSLEDGLWEEVLEAIASGADNARELAAEALKTRDIEFERWCA